MKTLYKAMLIILAVLLLCGCWNRRELDSLGVVLGIGIDQGERQGEVSLTVQTEKTARSGGAEGGGGGDEASFLNLTNIGSDLFTIIRDYNSEVTRKLYFPHNQVIVLGEDFAKVGVRSQLDLLLRDPETRMTVSVMVVKGKAKDVLNADPRLEPSPALDLSGLVRSQRFSSEAPDVNLFEFFSMLICPASAPIAPLIRLETDDEGKQKAVMAGTAVFKDDVMIGELNGVQTRGMLWVRGEVRSGILNVPDEDGHTVSMEIFEVKSKVTPVILPDGTPMIKVEINESGNIGSQQGTINQANTKTVKELEKKTAEVIKNEIELTIAKAQEMKADIFGFGTKFIKYQPKAWKTMEDNWPETFATLKVEVTVKADIKGTGKLTMPAIPAKEVSSSS